MATIGRFFQPLAVRTFKRNGLEQYHHHEVEPPDLVGLPKAVYSPHLSLLVGIGQHTVGVGRATGLDALDEVVTALLGDVFPQFCEKAHRPLLTNVDSLALPTQHERVIYNAEIAVALLKYG